jgi:hypothetical protein
MKHCPSCKTNYADDTLQFCLQDGTQLTELSDTGAPTVAFTPEQETVVRNNQTARNLAQPSQPEYNQPQYFAPPGAPPPQKSNTALIVGLTAFVMLLLFGAGLGAWLILGNRNEGGGNGNRDFYPSPTVTTNTNTNSKSPTPSPSASTTITPTINQTPTPDDIDEAQIKSEVTSEMNSWKASMESGNLDSVMSHYASTLNYYYRSGATSASAVRANKKPAFEKFYSFRVGISGMSITPDASGQKATAVFTKSWTFEGSGDSSKGSVRAQFQLTKIAGRWYITGEKDL